ncbi:type II toxin-antitoxin system VapC family toxin [Archaeoglobus neptunius]|uniref:type II toxin-antitoxin system VapC family toxin n=1 Tax=Archaeoglobus neptunius TaxID=2798580 RepID=UPI0019252ECA
MNYVLDAMAVLAYLGDEEGADKVEELLEKAERGEVKIFMNYVNLGEVYYIIARELGVSKANEAIAIVKRWNLEFVGVDESIALIAARIKAIHKLSYADAFVVATAIDRKGVIVTGDKEFDGVYPDILWIK